ncbi:MAG: zinc-dependent metalloprotease [Bacteroidales bacterium]
MRRNAFAIVAAIISVVIASGAPRAGAHAAEGGRLHAAADQQAKAPAQAVEKRDTTPVKIPTIEQKTAKLQKLDGFFPLYWDDKAGTLWMEIPALDTEVLYINGLSAGVGSNDIGLDRGQLGETRIVRFERVGTKVLMRQPNYRFRAPGGSADEQRAVRESFATSITWGFTVAAESRGRVLVDLTDFLLRDATGLAARLRPATFRVDRTRSAVYMANTKVFPKNTEMEATLTFTTEGSTAGAGGGTERGALSFVAPAADAVTVRQHHSFVELPDGNYTPRAYDPRAGFIDVAYEDYSAPLGESTTRRLITRHRLQKKDPSAAISEPMKPIVYYLDRAAPEPIRTALLEGAAWWNQAFEAAGFRNAFRVELMPEGADPMDVRYNVIQWVHRSTRGWSYGGGVVDPRTGEIIQGHVTLGSLRVRQDYLIGVGLTTPYKNGNEEAVEAQRMALERIRQLAPHEVGHAIGLSHNYYDSTRGYISVMDYPQPLATLRPDGALDLSHAYGVGIGDWDKVAITWGYSQFPRGADEARALDGILRDAWDKDLRFLTNQDIDYTPRADQWSNGVDVAAELQRVMEVRRAVLKRFGESVVRNGQPLALIEEPLVPIYLYHRYQVEAAASALGGLDYFYALRGGLGADKPWGFTPAVRQRAALDALMRTLAPSELAVPDPILRLLGPRPDGYGLHRELFPRNTGLPFDAITPAVVASDLTVSFLLRPDRAARLVNQHALDPTLPGVGDVIDRLVATAFDTAAVSPYEAEVRRATARVVVERLIALASSAPMAEVRAIASDRLDGVRERLKAVKDGDDRPMAKLLVADITRFLDRPAEPYKQPPLPTTPPGAPIGEPGYQWLPPYGTGTWWWEWWDGGSR